MLSAHAGNEPQPDVIPDLNTPHIIMYTAGTTGRPKGAVLSQGASFWNVLNLGLSMDFTSRDRNLVLLPMFHIELAVEPGVSALTPWLASYSYSIAWTEPQARRNPLVGLIRAQRG